MTSLAQTVRIAYKAGVDTSARVAMLVVTVAAARALSRDAFGVLALALATGWLLGIASDLGLPMYLTRAAARDHARLPWTLAAVVQLRLLLGAAAVVAALVAAWWWPPAQWRLAFGLIALSQVLLATLETIGHVFRGRDRSEIEAHFFLAERLAATIGALVVLAVAPDLTWLAIVLVIPPLITLPVAWRSAARFARREAQATSQCSTTLDAPRGFALARAAAPLGAGILVSALYFRIDVFFVEHWQGLAAVGAYSAVFRIVGAVRLLPSAVLAVLFPSLCRAQDVSAVARVGGWLLLAGAAIAAAIALAAPFIVTTVYGPSFADAVPVLQVLALSVPLFFLNYALTHQVIGWDHQRAYLLIVCVALVANVAANAVLVPAYGSAGAAAATGLTELVITAGCLWALAATQRARVSAARVVTRGLV